MSVEGRCGRDLRPVTRSVAPLDDIAYNSSSQGKEAQQ
jgi:hypothetical protein